MGMIERPLSGHLTMLREFSRLTKRVLDIVCEEKACRRLMSMPGVEPITGLVFRATIDRPERFGSSRSVGVHLGLTPARYQSGETDIQDKVIHCGDHSPAPSSTGRAASTVPEVTAPGRHWRLLSPEGRERQRRTHQGKSGRRRSCPSLPGASRDCPIAFEMPWRGFRLIDSSANFSQTEDAITVGIQPVEHPLIKACVVIAADQCGETASEFAGGRKPQRMFIEIEGTAQSAHRGMPGFRPTAMHGSGVMAVATARWMARLTRRTYRYRERCST